MRTSVSINFNQKKQMKKLILLGFLAIYTTLTFAQKNRNRAEVFIEIKDTGFYTVYLDNEFVGSENGRFRFYDVFNSNPTISIYKNNVVVFKRNVSVVQDQRLVLKYSAAAGMNVMKQLNLYRNVEYALDDFDNYNNNKSGNENNYVDTRTMSDAVFQQLNQMVKNESFEDRKTTLVLQSTKNALLTTQQVTVFLKQYSFESKMLNAAKAFYPKLIDPQNYFTVANLFNFPSYKRDFLEFLNSK